MNWPQIIRARIRALLTKRELDARMGEEMRSHIEMQTEENIQAGMRPADARRAALRQFGSVESIQETCRDQRGVAWIEHLVQDISFALRLLRKTPGFTAVAVLTLALGIGATTTVFSVVKGVLLKPLNFPGSDRIVQIWEAEPEPGVSRANTSPANFMDWRRESTVFEAIAFSAEHSGNFTRSFVLTGDGLAERLRGRFVSTDFFRVFGVEPMLGRSFLPEEEERGAPRVIVLSHRLWQDRFRADPGIIGKSITLENQGRNAWEVIGVMPPGFDYPYSRLWASVAHMPGDLKRRGGAMLQVVARLKPGVTIEQAQSEMNVIQARLYKEHSHLARRGKFLAMGARTKIEPMLEVVVGHARFSLLLFFVAVILVLLIACANVANLLLARGLARGREVAIRAALGASRGRIVRQLLTESLLLSLVGGASGVLLAVWGVKLVMRFSDGSIPRISEAAIDAPVLAFTLVVSVGTGLLFGLVPAWHSSKADLNETLKEGTQRATGSTHHQLSHAFTVIEVAVALLLLVGAGLLLQSFVRLQRVDPGFDASRLLTVEVDMAAAAYPDDERRRLFFRDLLERMRGVPGVEAVCGVSMIPDRGNGWPTEYHRTDRPVPPVGEQPRVSVRAVTPGYLKTYGIRLLKGRDFAESDSMSAPKVILINQAFADAVFPGEDPVGSDLNCAGVKEIIGVIANVKNSGLAGETRPEVYVIYQQWGWPSCFLTVRTSSHPLALSPLITEQVRALNPSQPLTFFRTMASYLDETTARPRFHSMLLGFFVLSALALASIGVYGVMAVSVAQRTQEMGVRLALGARKFDLLMLVLGRGMRLTLVGVLIGLGSAFALARLLTHQLYGVTATDPSTFAGVTLLLVAVAAFACFVPARRATRVDPIVALRHE
ncbi:MAG: ABC transporter permease [Verrucomicrobia bacterium]|nr:ABC transporter permease [Verrucomicrobiota bacterium]